ncbi:BnaA10g05570D [Brassica napus]|uniref:(rape) hypothetical protein n=1 Tax=Brassica napus TaxID=3708 RepID=A0A078HKC6_BRANA|nr:unnamed protein product [Brassica napus]CDY37764.1 BnaA10g05570D [Brassica napus]
MFIAYAMILGNGVYKFCKEMVTRFFLKTKFLHGLLVL